VHIIRDREPPPNPNLVSCAGLVPVVALAERAGLHMLIREHVRVPGVAGSNLAIKVVALIAGMLVGADSFDDMDLLAHGAMCRLFSAVRAPSKNQAGWIQAQ